MQLVRVGIGAAESATIPEGVDWKAFEGYVDEFGFRRFYDSFSRLGQYLIGEYGCELAGD